MNTTSSSNGAVVDQVEGLVEAKARQGDRFLIGNNRGGLVGWVGRRAIFGVATQIEARGTR